jgi:hypothetical protein
MKKSKEEYAKEIKSLIEGWQESTSEMPSTQIRIHMVNRLGLTIEGRQSSSVKKEAYMFVPFKDTKEFLLPILESARLSVVQNITADGDSVSIHMDIVDTGSYSDVHTTTFTQKMFNMSGMNIAQSNATVITMTKNNMLKSIFGILTDEDTDGKGEEIKEKPSKKVLIRDTDQYKQAVLSLRNGTKTIGDLDDIYILSSVLKLQLEHDSSAPA